MRIFCFLLLAGLISSCQFLSDAPVPNLYWEQFEAPGTVRLPEAVYRQMEGVYNVEGTKAFGDSAVLKWSYDIRQGDTLHYLSFFCQKGGRFFILQGRRRGNAILLNGYWRNVKSTHTGRARFTVAIDEEGFGLFQQTDRVPGITIEGVWGLHERTPENKMVLRRSRDLHRQTSFYIIAHRGGGRNNDLLPASENSLEMIRLASRLGANAVEIDIKFTRDSIPILYHDRRINDRLTRRPGIHGRIRDHTFAELDKQVNLKRGGKIPTLRDALHTIVYDTPLTFVWLDCKFEGPLRYVRALQQEYEQKAKEIGRQVIIAIGVPSRDVMKRFLMLPDHQQSHSLSELGHERSSKMGANYWATIWIKGLQNDNVKEAKANGMKAFAYTLDFPFLIRKYMRDGHYDGMVSNRPTIVAYEYYTRP